MRGGVSEGASGGPTRQKRGEEGREGLPVAAPGPGPGLGLYEGISHSIKLCNEGGRGKGGGGGVKANHLWQRQDQG